MRVTFINETTDSIHGFSLEYLVNNDLAGGNGTIICDGYVTKGTGMSFDYTMEDLKLETEKDFLFGMFMSVFTGDQSSVPVEFLCEWTAQLNNEYVFTITGSAKDGYEISQETTDWDCTITPFDELPADFWESIQ